MAYIGKEPIVGNFQVCDAISVVNGQAAYTMQVSSTNVVPESANHMLVSLNGILQKPNSSFTVSGSTITFASNLATGDVIDFIMLLGNVLDIGTPSDSTVTDAKANFVSTSSAAGLQIKGDGTTDGTLQLNCSQNSHGVKLASPAHSAGQSYTLKFPTNNVTAGSALVVDSISGSGTTATGQLTFGSAGGLNLIQTTTVSSATSSVSIDGQFSSSFDKYLISIIEMKISENATISYRHNHSGSAISSTNYKAAAQVYDSLTNTNNDAGQSRNYAAMHGTSQFGNNVNYGFNANIFINDPLSTVGFCSSFGQSATYTSGDAMQMANFSNILTVSANTPTSGITIFTHAGNINTAVIKLYGLS